MTLTKNELGKYELIPSKTVLLAYVNYFKTHADENGIVNLPAKKLLEDAEISKHIKSLTPAVAITTYLINEEFIKKLDTGTKKISKWDVTRLISSYDEVITREQTGKVRPERDKDGKLIVPNLPSSVSAELEIVKDSAPVEEVAAIFEETDDRPTSEDVSAPTAPKKSAHDSNINSVVLQELKTTMDTMMDFLNTLPGEMGSHLKQVSDKLASVDERSIKELQEEKATLQAEKRELESRIIELENQLKASSELSTENAHKIYRLRNGVLDEVDRAFSAPAWSMRQNGIHTRKTIVEKLDAILEQIGIDTKQPTK